MRFETLRKIAAALSQDQSLTLLLQQIVREVGHYRAVAIARIWLFEPARQCEICRAKPETRDLPPGLHLAASAGRPLKPGEDWGRIDDDVHGGGAKIQRISDHRQPLLIKDIRSDPEWQESPGWSGERIRGFAGFPLVFAGAEVGVIAVFSRAEIKPLEFERLRVLAVALAGTIVNTRASTEINHLRARLESENAYLREEASEVAGGTRILGASNGIREVLHQIEMVAPTDASVLILGETGVGKELVARAIHERSPRHQQALVKVNCTAIPRELFESEFFGHVKGAFSGATGSRMGRFQLADGGSLFLDEVGDLPPDIQPKLLRVLQDGEFQAVGDDTPRYADVRIIAASNHDLKKAVEGGSFREDLYYRLSVFPIDVPSLRSRADDIPALAHHFVDAACRRFNRSPLQLPADRILQLRNYPWPGNVRELQNVIERAVITSRLGAIHFDVGSGFQPRPPGKAAPVESAPPATPEILTEDEMKRRDRENIVGALRQAAGRIYGPGGAAEVLGMKPTTLNARIKKLNLTKFI
jgi:transcriptional regulator with GAF, ATPase, and Fis domain